VNPGAYTVRLTVNGKAYSQPIVVKPDPRVKTSAIAMQQVYSLSKATYDGAAAMQQAAQQARGIRDQIAKLQPQASGPSADALAAFDKKVEALMGAPAGGGRGRGQGPGGGGGRGGGRGAAPPDTLSGAAAALAGVMNSLQGADVQPTAIQVNAIASARANAARVMTRWTAIRTTELATLNGILTSAGAAAIVPSAVPGPGK
jgi:hypothetical protein